MIRETKNLIGWGTCTLVIGLFLLGFALPHTPYQRTAVLEYTTDQDAHVTVYLMSTEDGNPLFYSTRLQSPVCMENLCNPIDIEIEWDLLGDFKTYNEIPGDPITKFDHQPLDSADHAKLKAILGNKESLLQDYKMEDLVDTTIQVYSEELDATTGATSKTFENDIVSGAIYTCYTLWNFINGDLQDQLLDYTKSILDDELIGSMIQSGQKNYLEFVLALDSGDFSTKTNEMIGSLIWSGDPYVSVQAIHAVRDDYWQSDSSHLLFASGFLQTGNPVQNALIQYFKDGDVRPAYLSTFIDLLPDINERQKLQVYEILKSNKNTLNEELKNKLLAVFKSIGSPRNAKEYELLSTLGL